MSVASLIQDSKLLLVTGKGGTGKTTFTAALGALGAARGRRTLVCEMDIQRPSMEAVFEVRASFEPLPVRPNLWLSNVLYEDSLETFVKTLVPVRGMAGMVLQNGMVRRFMDFTPGAREMVTLSALGTLWERYDLVVVDMPASGHAFSLLDITRSALGLFRSGPMRQRATEVIDMIHDARTRMVFVALPEEMVVNETLETYQRMESFGLLKQPGMVFLNRATLPSLTDEERLLLARLGHVKLDPEGAEFVRAGRWEDELEQATAASRDRLTAALPVAPVLVPPAPPGGTPRSIAEAVSVHLGRSMGLTRRDLTWT